MIQPEEVQDAVTKFREDKNKGLVKLSDPTSLGREIMAAIAAKIPPSKIADTIHKLLDSSRTLKNGTVLADTRAMEAGVKLYLAYMVGVPVQRQEVINVNVDADASAGLLERLKASPAFRDQLGKLLAEANATGAVDVDSETVQK